MTIGSYEEHKKMLTHRASILAAETARLAGASIFTQEDLDTQIEVLLNDYN